MKTVLVNHTAVIIRGALEGHAGKVVSYDSVGDELILEMDMETYVYVTSDMVIQEDIEKD